MSRLALKSATVAPHHKSGGRSLCDLRVASVVVAFPQTGDWGRSMSNLPLKSETHFPLIVDRRNGQSPFRLRPTALPSVERISNSPRRSPLPFDNKAGGKQ